MGLEIERKFLVLGPYQQDAFKVSHIRQGYLASGPMATARVRTKGDRGYLTIKGKSDAKGISRYEWEKEIPFSEAQELLQLCGNGLIEKNRYEIKVGRHVFEVDEFLGENLGLTLAEVELGAEDEVFEKPGWLGEEVTGDRRYYNSQLSRNPYNQWPKI